jgi:nucleoside-diphosphate-sugar epimerase
MSTQIVVGDLEEAETLSEAVKNVDIVFHCAANVRTWDRAAQYESTNVRGLHHLLDAIKNSGGLPQRFVHVSTVDVYGFPKAPCSEDCPTKAPGFGYGDSKLRGENLLRSRALSLGLSYVILRPTNVMGPRSPFIERIGQELRSGLMLRIDGGDIDAGFLFVDNLVEVLLWAGEDPRAVHETFNVRDPVAISWRQFLRDFKTRIRGHGMILDLPYGMAELAATVLESPYRWLSIEHEPMLHRLIVRIFGRSCGHSIAKLQAAGAPVGKISYPEAMQRSVDWFLQHFPQ